MDINLDTGKFDVKSNGYGWRRSSDFDRGQLTNTFKNLPLLYGNSQTVSAFGLPELPPIDESKRPQCLCDNKMKMKFNKPFSKEDLPPNPRFGDQCK